MNIKKKELFSVLGLSLFSFFIGGNILAVQPLVSENLNISTMIDNQVDARPASGINEADAVFEFPVESGITRLMTIYKAGSNVDPRLEIGPIRSARPYFAQIAGAFNSVFAHAGGSQLALDRIIDEKYKIIDMDYLKNASTFFERKEDDGRTAPHNLFTTFGQIKFFADQNSANSDLASWPWKISGLANGENMFAQNVVDVDYDGNDYDVRWIFSSSDNKYYRQIKNADAYVDYLDAQGRKVGVENLVVQYAQTNSLKEIVESNGRSLMCRGGKCQIGKWKQADHDSAVKFYDMQENEFSFISGKIWINVTGNRFFHDITLSPGWNVVSTPRIVLNHQFSATENLNNFDIFVLNANNISGWSTLGDLGQTEFTPMYGYFVNNKTGKNQTLTLNYKKDINPSEALFERTLKAGWNVVGVANPAYALKQNAIAGEDRDNVGNILNSAGNGISSVLDFNYGQARRNDVKISETWDAKVFSQSYLMNDWLETKAYGVYLSSPAVYSGYQNFDAIHSQKPLAVNVYNSSTQVAEPGEFIELADFDVATGDDDLYVTQIAFNLLMDKAISSDNLEAIQMINIDTRQRYYPTNNSQGSKLKHEIYFEGVNLSANTINNFKIWGKVPSGASNEQKYHLTLGSGRNLYAYNLSTWSPVLLSDVSYNSTEGGNYVVKNIDNILKEGKFTMAFDPNYPGLNTAKNILAGSETMVGRIKLTAQYENVVIEDFTLFNLLGTATADDIAYLNLYSNAEMTTKIGSAVLDENKKAVFENVNIGITTSASRHVYIGAVLKGINYSTANMTNAGANAGRTIKLNIASSTGYAVKALGVSTGYELANTGVSSSTPTNTATIMGAVISNITSAFANGLLSNGTGKDIFSFKVTVPESTNLDYDMSELGVKLATTTFTVSTSSGVRISNFMIQRVGGQNGEKIAMSMSSPATMGAGTFVINFPDTYRTDEDLIVRPGETAEFIIKATIAGVDANDSTQVTLEGLTSNVNYTHNTGYLGTDGSDTSAVYTLLPATTYVRGGSLTN